MRDILTEVQNISARHAEQSMASPQLGQDARGFRPSIDGRTGVVTVQEVWVCTGFPLSTSTGYDDIPERRGFRAAAVRPFTRTRHFPAPFGGEQSAGRTARPTESPRLS